MGEEIHAIEKNDTRKLTYLPENKKAKGVKWVYKNKEVELISCNTNDQVADIFTKPLKGEIFIRLKFMLGMTSLD
jgi:hypothetical protein